jgi:hypothetical protein
LDQITAPLSPDTSCAFDLDADPVSGGTRAVMTWRTPSWRAKLADIHCLAAAALTDGTAGPGCRAARKLADQVFGDPFGKVGASSSRAGSRECSTAIDGPGCAAGRRHLALRGVAR